MAALNPNLTLRSYIDRNRAYDFLKVSNNEFVAVANNIYGVDYKLLDHYTTEEFAEFYEAMKSKITLIEMKYKGNPKGLATEMPVIEACQKIQNVFQTLHSVSKELEEEKGRSQLKAERKAQKERLALEPVKKGEKPIEEEEVIPTCVGHAIPNPDIGVGSSRRVHQYTYGDLMHDQHERAQNRNLIKAAEGNVLDYDALIELGLYLQTNEEINQYYEAEPSQRLARLSPPLHLVDVTRRIDQQCGSVQVFAHILSKIEQELALDMHGDSSNILAVWGNLTPEWQDYVTHIYRQEQLKAVSVAIEAQMSEKEQSLDFVQSVKVAVVKERDLHEMAVRDQDRAEISALSRLKKRIDVACEMVKAQPVPRPTKREQRNLLAAAQGQPLNDDDILELGLALQANVQFDGNAPSVHLAAELSPPLHLVDINKTVPKQCASVQLFATILSKIDPAVGHRVLAKSSAILDVWNTLTPEWQDHVTHLYRQAQLKAASLAIEAQIAEKEKSLDTFQAFKVFFVKERDLKEVSKKDPVRTAISALSRIKTKIDEALEIVNRQQAPRRPIWQPEEMEARRKAYQAQQEQQEHKE